MPHTWVWSESHGGCLSLSLTQTFCSHQHNVKDQIQFPFVPLHHKTSPICLYKWCSIMLVEVSGEGHTVVWQMLRQATMVTTQRQTSVGRRWPYIYLCVSLMPSLNAPNIKAGMTPPCHSPQITVSGHLPAATMITSASWVWAFSCSLGVCLWAMVTVASPAMQRSLCEKLPGLSRILQSLKPMAVFVTTCE